MKAERGKRTESVEASSVHEPSEDTDEDDEEVSKRCFLLLFFF
jgi:hypothetical protein